MNSMQKEDELKTGDKVVFSVITTTAALAALFLSIPGTSQNLNLIKAHFLAFLLISLIFGICYLIRRLYVLIPVLRALNPKMFILTLVLGPFVVLLLLETLLILGQYYIQTYGVFLGYLTLNIYICFIIFLYFLTFKISGLKYKKSGLVKTVFSAFTRFTIVGIIIFIILYYVLPFVFINQYYLPRPTFPTKSTINQFNKDWEQEYNECIEKTGEKDFCYSLYYESE